MMGAAREWLTAVVLVTVVLSVAQQLLPEGTLRQLGSFLGGLILLVALLRPLLGAELERLDLEPWYRAVEERQAELETASGKELAALIEARTESYISEQTGVDAAVVTGLQNGVPVPEEVHLAAPYAPEIAVWLATEVGIPEERQVWNHEI